MNGILCAYLRANDPSTPNVDATALQPPSIASFTIFSGSKYCGFGANDAPAECSIPWSTGRIETYPVPARRPVFRIVWKFRSTVGRRSLGTSTRSTKSGPGRCNWLLEKPLAVYVSRSASFPSRSSIERTSPAAMRQLLIILIVVRCPASKYSNPAASHTHESAVGGALTSLLLVFPPFRIAHSSSKEQFSIQSNQLGSALHWANDLFDFVPDLIFRAFNSEMQQVKHAHEFNVQVTVAALLRRLGGSPLL